MSPYSIKICFFCPRAVWISFRERLKSEERSYFRTLYRRFELNKKLKKKMFFPAFDETKANLIRFFWSDGLDFNRRGPGKYTCSNECAGHREMHSRKCNVIYNRVLHVNWKAHIKPLARNIRTDWQNLMSVSRCPLIRSQLKRIVLEEVLLSDSKHT